MKMIPKLISLAILFGFDLTLRADEPKDFKMVYSKHFNRGEVTAAVEHINQLNPKLEGLKTLKKLIEGKESPERLLQIYLLATSIQKGGGKEVGEEVRAAAAAYLFCIGDHAKSLAPIILADLLRPQQVKTRWEIQVSLGNEARESLQILGLEHLFWSIKETSLKLALEYLDTWIPDGDDRIDTYRIAKVATIILNPETPNPSFNPPWSALILELLRLNDPKRTLLAVEIAINEDSERLDSKIESDKLSSPMGPIVVSETFRARLSRRLSPLVLDQAIEREVRERAYSLLKKIDLDKSKKILSRLNENKDPIYDRALIISKSDKK